MSDPIQNTSKLKQRLFLLPIYGTPNPNQTGVLIHLDGSYEYLSYGDYQAQAEPSDFVASLSVTPSPQPAPQATPPVINLTPDFTVNVIEPEKDKEAETFVERDRDGRITKFLTRYSYRAR